MVDGEGRSPLFHFSSDEACVWKNRVAKEVALSRNCAHVTRLAVSAFQSSILKACVWKDD